MPGLLSAMEGFCVIGIVIGTGYAAARLRIGGPTAQMVLNRFSFFVSSPCLMFAILSKEKIFEIFHSSIIVAFFSAMLVGAVFLILNRLFFHMKPADATIGALNSLYLNSNNIGLPIATYILGNPALVAPILVMQQAVFTPIGLTVLDGDPQAAVASTAAHRFVARHRRLRGLREGRPFRSAELHLRSDQHDRQFRSADDSDGVRHVVAWHEAVAGKGRHSGDVHGGGAEEHRDADHRIPAELLRDGVPWPHAIRVRGACRPADRPERLQLCGTLQRGPFLRT